MIYDCFDSAWHPPTPPRHLYTRGQTKQFWSTLINVCICLNGHRQLSRIPTSDSFVWSNAGRLNVRTVAQQTCFHQPLHATTLSTVAKTKVGCYPPCVTGVASNTLANKRSAPPASIKKDVFSRIDTSLGISLRAFNRFCNKCLLFKFLKTIE